MSTNESLAHHVPVPTDSCLQLALLFAPPGKRRALTVLHGFRAQLWTIARATPERDVARVKLQWWREEVERILRGEPIHPLGKEMADVMQRFDLEKSRLEEIFAGAERELRPGLNRDWDELDEHCHLTEGALQLLASQIGAGNAAQAPSAGFPEKLGQALRLTQIIRNVRDDAMFGRTYIPLAALEERGLNVDALRAPVRSSPTLRALLEDLCRRADTRLDALSNELAPKDYTAQTPGLILAALSRELLRKMRRLDFDSGERKTDIGALHKLWIAWRTARRAARQRF